MSGDAFDDLLGAASSPSAAPAESPAVVLVPTTAGDTSASSAYDAADRRDQALNLWSSPLQSADADILPDKYIIDGKSRDMLRNDAFVQGGANLHKDNIVGAHYLLNTRPATKVLWGKEDEVWEAEFQEEVEEKFDLDAESPDNLMDAQRTNSFTSLVRLAVGQHLAAGEVLAAVEWIKDGRPFNTAIQMLDLDRLSDPHDRIIMPGERENIRGGIKFNSRGAPQSYYIQTSHPTDIYYSILGMPEWKEVPIRKPWGRLQIIHIHEQTRPDQSRGISELATSLREQKMRRKFSDVSLQRAIMQSMYAAAITSELPSAEVFMRMGGTSLSAEDAQAAVTAYATGYMNSLAEYTSGAKGIRLDGARIPHFYPGTKLEMMSPTSGQALGTEFESSLLRYIAASIGVSYEQLSKDYSSTNYSSARAAMTETWKFMQARKKLVADRFASLVFRLWLEEAIRKNEITTFPQRKSSMLYTGGMLNRRFDAISRCDWVGASRGQIDELKETQAAVLRINNGLSTAEDELARLGRDWRKVYRQLKREMAMRETLGLMFAANDPATQAQLNALSASPTDEPQPKAA
jgi:lambda family phage portal protein